MVMVVQISYETIEVDYGHVKQGGHVVVMVVVDEVGGESFVETKVVPGIYV